MSPPLRDPTSDSEDDDPDYAPPEHQGVIIDYLIKDCLV